MPSKQSNSPRIAAFIGRFQPVHHGHIVGIRQLVDDHDQVHIVVASFSKKSKINPLTHLEAKHLLVKSLKEAGIDMNKVRVSTMRRPKRYKGDPLFFIHGQLQKRIGQPFMFYTGNRTVHEILSSRNLPVKFFDVDSLPVSHVPLGKGEALNATYVREAIATSKPWEHLVPAAAARLIKQRKLHTRMKELHERGDEIHPHYK